MQEMWVRSLSWEDPLEKEMATHSSVLAWGIPWTEEPPGLQSTGSQSVRDLLTEQQNGTRMKAGKGIFIHTGIKIYIFL